MMSSGVIEVPLTQGKVALIDAEDYELVSRYKWYAARAARTFYAMASAVAPDGNRTVIVMHRIILGLSDPSEKTDHISGDGLDNRRCNLRPATNAENGRNRGAQANNTSGFKGVHAARGRWQSRIGLDGNRLHLGYFDTPQEAALAYDAKARELHGDFARLNFP